MPWPRCPWSSDISRGHASLGIISGAVLELGYEVFTAVFVEHLHYARLVGELCSGSGTSSRQYTVFEGIL